MTLKQKYEELVNQYLTEFINKQEYEFDYWVGGDVGGIASFIEQYFFNFDDIRHDIDNNVKSGKIFTWQDNQVEYNMKMNYKNYAKYGKIENNKK